jgi:hypothetical protein
VVRGVPGEEGVVGQAEPGRRVDAQHLARQRRERLRAERPEVLARVELAVAEAVRVVAAEVGQVPVGAVAVRDQQAPVRREAQVADRVREVEGREALAPRRSNEDRA